MKTYLNILGDLRPWHHFYVSIINCDVKKQAKIWYTTLYHIGHDGIFTIHGVNGKWFDDPENSLCGLVFK